MSDLRHIWSGMGEQEKGPILGGLSRDKTLINRHFMWANQGKVHKFRRWQTTKRLRTPKTQFQESDICISDSKSQN